MTAFLSLMWVSFRTMISRVGCGPPAPLATKKKHAKKAASGRDDIYTGSQVGI
jgi:hypothetical protein